MRKQLVTKVFSTVMAVMLMIGMVLPTMTYAQAKDLNKHSDAQSHMLDAVQKQEAFQKQKPYLHTELQGLKGDKQIEVIVHLSENPVALEKAKKLTNQLQFTRADEQRALKKVSKQQVTFLQKLKTSNIQANKGYSFTHVLNGVALSLQEKDVETLLNLPGVIHVEPDAEMIASEVTNASHQPKASMKTSISHLGIEELWEQGLEGQGVKVGVIDSGIDYQHPEFADVYKGGKNYVVHDGNYLNPRADDDPYETSPKDRPDHMSPVDARGNTYETSHGTHVAGTIAAKGDNPYGIKGLAPKVDLYAYRVLGAYGSGNMSWVVKGIEDAVTDGMDVINLSLGASSTSSTTADALAINHAMLAGVVSVISSGNSGPDRKTVSSPGTASLGITVGNTTNPEIIKESDVTIQAGAYDRTVHLALMGWKYGEEPEEVLAGELDVIAIPGVGNPDDFAGLDVKGKIALIARGEIPFVDKIAAAKDAGALGTLIHNAEDGSNAPGVSDVYLGDSFAYIPSYDMSYTDGQALREALAANGGEGTVSFHDFSSSETTGDVMNDSSSRGPSDFNLDIKPDVSAPGTNIMSSVAAYQKDFPDATYTESYERYTGTSMAAPHIAGIAALLVQKNNDWSAFDVKVALSNTAKVLDTKQFDVYDQGAGRVNPVQAVAAEARAYHVKSEVINGTDYSGARGTVSFGALQVSNSEELVHRESITIENLRSEAATYTVEVEVTDRPTGDMAGVQVTADQTEIRLTDEASFALQVKVPAGKADRNDEVLGFVHISNGTTVLTLPFAAGLGEQTVEGIKSMALEGYHISPNGDGKSDTTNAVFEFHDMQFISLLYFWDALDPEGGLDGDGTAGDIWQEVGVEAGQHKVEISNTILDPADNSKTKTIPDGVYTVDLVTLTYESNELYAEYDGPLFIVSEAPEITLENKTKQDGVISGSVASKYFEFKEPLDRLHPNLGYDPLDYLDTSYVLNNLQTNKKETGSLTIQQDGTFELPVTKAGDYALEVKVTDAAQNSGTATVDFQINGDLTMKYLTPGQDVYAVAGDQVKISFYSDYYGGDASYSVLVPNAKAADRVSANMKEVNPGYYEAIWTVPNNVKLEGAEIQVELKSKEGKKVTNKTKGKLYIYPEAIERLSGYLRYDTAVEVSKEGWASADTVILARGDDYADALAGVPLAYELDAPILLTANNKLVEQAEKEIKRLKPKKIILLGGENALSNHVEKAAKKLANTERIQGNNRVETAVKIAGKMKPNQAGKAVVVNGYDFPDAMSVAAHAAKEGLPILLTQAKKLSAGTKQAIQDLNVKQTILVGGEKVVAPNVAKQLPNTKRLEGSDRYGTNIEVAKHFGVKSKSLYVATGMEFADALTSAVLAAKKDSAIILVHRKVPALTADYLKRYNTKHLTVLGGPVAVDETVYEALRKIVK